MQLARRLFGLLTMVLWASIAQGQSDFNPSDHGQQDLTYLQAALVFEGVYDGTLDGVWGNRSQAALARFAQSQDGTSTPTDAHLITLLRQFESERQSAQWTRQNNDETNVSVMLPLGILRETDFSLPYLTYATDRRDLMVRWIIDSRLGTADLHRWARDAHAGPTRAYFTDTGRRVVTAAKMSDGRRVYLASWRRGPRFLTLLIQSEPPQHRRAALIAASAQEGGAPDLTLRPDGRLARLLAMPSQAVPPVAPTPPQSAPDLRLTKGTGTGFFVTPTEVVTAAHVIGGCRAVTLGDGTPLTLISQAPEPDLAVLRTATPSDHWLPLRREPELRLGQSVAAVGFPFLTLTGGALSLTTGNVSALRALAARPDWVAISAPVQPGNSGGPLLSDMGEVVGVVVARANDGFYLKETGALPQNINFAVSLARLRGFLGQTGITLPDSNVEPALPLSQGLSRGKQDAIQPVLCY